MINFVRPSFLGTLGEFRNRFVGPITNGLAVDSTRGDVLRSKKRMAVLFRKARRGASGARDGRRVRRWPSSARCCSARCAGARVVRTTCGA